MIWSSIYLLSGDNKSNLAFNPPFASDVLKFSSFSLFSLIFSFSDFSKATLISKSHGLVTELNAI